MKPAIQLAALTLTLTMGMAWAQSTTPPADSFPPFEQWKAAVLAADAAALKSLYSTDPAAQIRIKSVMQNADADTGFWLGLKPKSMHVEFVRLIVRPNLASVIFRAEVTPGAGDEKKISLTDDQIWQKQGDQWRLVAAERTDAPQLPQPADMKKDLYPADADAHAEVREAEAKAAKEHKRLLLVFGANWCFDCHVLDLAFHRPDLAALVDANYEIVHVDIGSDGHKNGDVAKEFGIPLDKGVPAIAVAESNGTVVFSSKNGEVEDARGLTTQTLADFLNKWKPEAR
ncbi:MAG TPA: thioredoxin family protein [Candidatus Dormibacteraeota bacterium]|nr:thioredoxin family protein [Candidatus Dormibacteraeota bacterium]